MPARRTFLLLLALALFLVSWDVLSLERTCAHPDLAACRRFDDLGFGAKTRHPHTRADRELACVDGRTVVRGRRRVRA